jgi:alcohol dehydrogenase
MLSDILPTGFEVGVLKGAVKPGDTVAIVGAGPIGLATLLTARFFSPAELIVVDLDDNRLATARELEAREALDPQHPSRPGSWTPTRRRCARH